MQITADQAPTLTSGATNCVIAKAMEKVAAENMTRDELKKGMLLREVYEKYGVL